MSLISEAIKKEKNRIVFMLDGYNKRLIKLPKGSLSEIQNGDKCYYYLKYRVGDKVISKYIAHSDLEIIKCKIEERKHIEKMIKYLKEELIIANKALGEKK